MDGTTSVALTGVPARHSEYSASLAAIDSANKAIDAVAYGGVTISAYAFCVNQ
jgi:hypothetical protein